MITTPLFMELDNVRRSWGWLLALGLIQIVLGIVALFMVPVATLATVLVLGWLMTISGVIETIHAFRVQRWGGFFLHLTAGILGILVGLMIVTHPLAGALVWTMLFAALFTVLGVFDVIAAARLKFPNWGWAVFEGVVTFALGILLWAHWPTAAVWFLGVAVGVSLILRGWSHTMFALAIRNLPAVPSEIRRAA